jgi:transcriptional regulator with XRE-family HTH domain
VSPFEPLKQTRARTRLARRRLAAGVTQRQMWEALGVSRATYLRLEHGRMDNPSLRLLQNCAIALGCALDDLIEDDWRRWYTPAGYVPTRPPRFADHG